MAEEQDKPDNAHWFYALKQDGEWKRFGPVTEDEIKNLIDSRKLSPDDLVWSPHLPDWSAPKDAGFNVSVFPPPLPIVRRDTTPQELVTSTPISNKNVDEKVKAELCPVCHKVAGFRNGSCANCNRVGLNDSASENPTTEQQPQENEPEANNHYLKCKRCGHFAFVKGRGCVRCGAKYHSSLGPKEVGFLLFILTVLISVFYAGSTGYSSPIRVGIYHVAGGMGGALITALISWGLTKGASAHKAQQPKYWVHYLRWVPVMTFVDWLNYFK